MLTYIVNQSLFSHHQLHQLFIITDQSSLKSLKLPLTRREFQLNKWQVKVGRTTQYKVSRLRPLLKSRLTKSTNITFLPLNHVYSSTSSTNCHQPTLTKQGRISRGMARCPQKPSHPRKGPNPGLRRSQCFQTLSADGPHHQTLHLHWCQQ